MPSAEPGGESLPWQLGLGELMIDGGSLNLSDQSIQPAAMVDVSGLQFKLSDISNQDDALFPLELSGSLLQGGSFSPCLANPAAIKQYEGLKYTDDTHDAFYLAKLMRLGILPTGYLYPREQRGVRDLLRRQR